MEASKKLEYFARSEFNHPEKMDKQFLRFLDNVRKRSEIPFYITSDWRDPAENQRVGGVITSLHMLGRAVDFATPGSRARDRQVFHRELWKITESVILERAFIVRPTQIQLELVRGANDWHVHIGMYPDGDPRKSKLVIAVD